jgi:nitrile hydratase accessory protein
VSDVVAAEVREMTGPAALPRQNGDLVFEAPWQGRAFGVAVNLARSLDVDWDEFRRRLIAAIDDDPERPYFESWLAALEALVVERTDVTPEEIARRAGEPIVRDELGMGLLEIFPLPTDEDTLLALLHELFDHWWADVRFGPLIQGAVYEISLAHAPEGITVLDGYATVDLGNWHFHLCIGEHRGLPGDPVSPELARVRRCARAELYRVIHDDAPVSWGLRLYNGADEQQLTVLLPNPFLDEDQRVRDVPDWQALACWDRLRERFLGLPPDERDRKARRFHHG